MPGVGSKIIQHKSIAVAQLRPENHSLAALVASSHGETLDDLPVVPANVAVRLIAMKNSKGPWKTALNTPVGKIVDLVIGLRRVIQNDGLSGIQLLHQLLNLLRFPVHDKVPAGYQQTGIGIILLQMPGNPTIGIELELQIDPPVIGAAPLCKANRMEQLRTAILPDRCVGEFKIVVQIFLCRYPTPVR